MLSYCINVDLGRKDRVKVYKSRPYRACITIFIGHELGKSTGTTELPSDKGGNRSRGAIRDIGSGPLTSLHFIYF